MPISAFHRIPWIFFDLDDTLWSFAHNSLESLIYIYKTYPEFRNSFPSSREFIDMYHYYNSMLWERYNRGEISTDFLRPERWRQTLVNCGFRNATENYCRQIDSDYLDHLANLPNVIKEADGILNRLSKDFMLAVISNGFADTQYKKLKSSGLEKYITRTIISDEIGVGKPNPCIFDYAIEETGATGPRLMIGDNFNTDVLGALNAGWYVIWLNSKKLTYSLDGLKAIYPEIDFSHLLAIVTSLEEIEPPIRNFLDY